MGWTPLNAVVRDNQAHLLIVLLEGGGDWRQENVKEWYFLDLSCFPSR